MKVKFPVRIQTEKQHSVLLKSSEKTTALLTWYC